MKKLILYPRSFENFDAEHDGNLFLFPSAFLDSDKCKFRDLKEDTLVNVSLSVEDFDKEFQYLNDLTNKILSILPDLFNSYYSIRKAEVFWTTLILTDLRDVLELVYARYLQLKAIEGRFRVEILKNSEEFLQFESARLFNLNTNFIATVDWALSSFILQHSDLNRNIEPSFVSVNQIDFPKFKGDQEYYHLVVGLEKDRIKLNSGSVFPFYVSFPGERLAISLGQGIETKSLLKKYKNDNQTFQAYYYGIPILHNFKKRVLFKTLKENLLSNSMDEFSKFFIGNIETFFPSQFFSLRVPALSNIKTINIGLPGATIMGAESRGNGGISFGIQHGTAYGMYTSCTQEWTERHVCDAFITWGWVDSEKGKPTIPLPSPYLSSLNEKLINSEETESQNLVIGVIFNTTYSRIGKFLRVAMPFFLIKNLELLNKILNFANRIPNSKIILSEYAYEQGFDLKLQLDSRLLTSDNIYFERMAGEKLLYDSDLIITNSFGTSFFERLVVNKPILVFNDFFEISNYGKSWLRVVNKLMEVGIYNTEQDNFGKVLNRSKDDLRDWWFSGEVQDLRIEVLKNFAWVEANWKDYFADLIDKHFESLKVEPSDKIKVPFLIKLCSWVIFRINRYFL